LHFLQKQGLDFPSLLFCKVFRGAPFFVARKSVFKPLGCAVGLHRQKQTNQTKNKQTKKNQKK